MYSLKEICPVVKGTLLGNDVTFTGVSTDTRTINAGDLFVAIVGEKFDAHDFLEEAQKKGAVAALVSRSVKTSLPCVQVQDTLIGLGELAAWHRSHFSIPVIGLTGSCGKTTVKNMLATILESVAPTLASEGNLNNTIGMPLSLMKLTSKHKYAVLEMGADHIGEIEYLSRIAKPTVSFITCVRPVHLEGFGSIENIAKAKGEIYENLPDDGVAIINQDEPYKEQWRKSLTTQSVITFGLTGGDVTAKNIQSDSKGLVSFTLCIDKKELPVTLQLLGEHNVLNALAAASAAFAVNIPVSAIQEGLIHTKTAKGRLMQRHGHHGALILDDHYNSNPAALHAALTILEGFDGPKIAVLGDMLELGPTAKDQHREVAEWLEDAEVDHFFAYGELMKEAADAFTGDAHHFMSHDALAQALRPLLTADTTVLVKGSRGMKLENVVAKILD